MRQEVWEYEGGQWLHGRSSTECLDDWEEEDEDCGCDQLEVGGMRFSRRWEDDDVDDGDGHCRDCCRRKGQESYYSCEDVYCGRRRERRDLDEGRYGFGDSDRRRRQRSEYYDDEDDLDLGRQRQRWEGRDSRSVETRRYCDDGREYNRRRERRDFNSDDVADVRRAGRYAEDVGGFDRRRESRDFEIDDNVEVRREGRHHSNDHRYVSQHQRSEDTDGEDVSHLRSRHWNDKEIDYNERDLADRRYYSGVRSQKSAGASSLHEDDSKRASNFRSTFDARHTGQKENSASSVRWHDNVGRRTEQISEERDRRRSAGWSNDERDRYDYDDAQFVRVRDSRIGRQDDKFITEDTRFASSSKNTSILKHGSNADQQAAVHKDGSRKSSQKIMEISEVQDNSTEQDSRAQHYRQEDRENYTKNTSSSVQNSVKTASDSRRQVDQRNEVNQNLVSVTDSRKKLENLNVTTDSSRNVSRASHSLRNYDEVNQMDIDDSSTSLQNVTHVTRDKKRIVNQQVIHETDIDVQNITHVDISKIHASDTSTSRSSQSHMETRSDINSSSSMGFINRTISQEKEGYQNKISASDSAMIRGSQSHLETGLYDPFHSKPSTNIADNKRESQEQAEFDIANASNAVVASTSGSHLQTRIDDSFQSSSAVTIGSMKEQIDLAKIHASDATVVSSSQGPVTRNGNQVHKASAVHCSRERQGKNGQQITQVSYTERDDEARNIFPESSQDTHHNMDLIWQQADTSGISDDKNITGLLVESTEKRSSMTDVDMGQAATLGSYDQEVRSETTAGSSLPSDSSVRQFVKESMLESAARLEKSSSFLVGRFVDELQKGVSDADATSTKKTEKSIVEGIASSSSMSRSKGPADEMWDVHSTTSQETFKTADKEEGSPADGATNSASQTPTNESALARKVHKSLWAYVADIIRLGFIQRGDSHDSSHKSVKKSSSNNSQSTEGWLSGQDRDNDGTKKKNGSTNAKHQQLIKLHGGEQESGLASMSNEGYLHTGTHGLQISETSIEPQVDRSEGDLFPTSSTDIHISGERIKQSDAGELSKGNSIDDSAPTSLDITIGNLPEHKTATSRIATEGSGEFGKGMLAGSSSLTVSAMEAGRSGDGADWIYDPSDAITPYHDPQTQAVMPHENTSTGILGPPALPVGVCTRFEEKNVVQEAPEIIKTGGKDTELKRRMFQRNKQVLKNTFDEWEEAYQRDAEQRKADELFMREALIEAQRAADIWEVPVGAVLVQNGEIIARGCNL